jgi:hypothetical protein
MDMFITSESLIQEAKKIDVSKWRLVKPHEPEYNDERQKIHSVELHSGNPTKDPAFRFDINEATSDLTNVELLKGTTHKEFIIVGPHVNELLRSILSDRPELLRGISVIEESLGDLKHPKDL